MLNNTQTMEAAPAPAKTGGMLGRLLKYEFRATARLYLPLYLVVLALGLLGRLSLFGVPWHVSYGGEGYGSWFSAGPQLSGFWGEALAVVISLTLVAYVLAALGAFVVHFIITIQRFWKNLMGDEGYLMFTLPVSTDAILWSKAICAFVWSIATVVAVTLSVLLLCVSPELVRLMGNFIRQNISPSTWRRIWIFLTSAFPASLWAKMVLMGLLDGFEKLFVLYAAMAIGHTVNRHKVLASVGGYLAIAMVEGIVSGTLSTGLMPFLAKPVTDLPEDLLFVTEAEMAQFSTALGQMLSGTMLLGVVLSGILAAAAYLLARYLLQTQLNLE